MLPSSNNNSNQNNNANLPKCDQFFRSIPFACLAYYVCLILCWALDLFFGLGQSFLTNNFPSTISKMQLWRLITSNFFQQSLLFNIFIILNFQTFLPFIQRKKGSTYLIVDLISRGFKVQGIIILLQFLLQLLQIKTSSSSSGALGLWFNYMVVFCFLNSKKMKFCCFNLKFPRKYFPLIMGAIICLLQWRIRIDILVGLVFGLIQATLLKNIKQLCPKCLYQKIDVFFRYIGFSNFRNWNSLSISQTFQYQCTQNVFTRIEIEQNQLVSQNDQMDQISTTTNQSNKQKNKDPFANLKGVRLGDY